MEPPRKRPRLEEAHERTADSVRIEYGLNRAYSQESGANLASTQKTSDPSTVTDGHTPSPHEFPPVSETLNTIEQHDTTKAIQSTNSNSQDLLPMPSPSLEVSGEDIDLMQSWPSDRLELFGCNPTAQNGWGDIDSMHSWFASDLTFMEFEST